MIPEGGVGSLPVVGEVSEGGPHQGLHVWPQLLRPFSRFCMRKSYWQSVHWAATVMCLVLAAFKAHGLHVFKPLADAFFKERPTSHVEILKIYASTAHCPQIQFSFLACWAHFHILILILKWFLIQVQYIIVKDFLVLLTLSVLLSLHNCINIPRQIPTHRRISMIEKMILRYTDKK